MHSIQYTLLGCHLDLLGHGVEDGENSTITELKQFSLDLEAHVRLTGNHLHLEALAETLLPYARHIISGQLKEFESTNGMVSITPWHRGHRLRFREDKDEDNSGSYDVQLDDGELANVVRFLDAVIQDHRFQVDITAPTMQGLRERELLNRLPLRQRLVAPLGGLVLAMALAGLSFLVPVPERFRITDPEEPQEGAPAGEEVIETIEAEVEAPEAEAEIITPGEVAPEEVIEIDNP